MKRSPALAPLSRDHHRALEVALRLRRADSQSADAAIARFGEFWRHDGQRHFEIEEELILSALPASDPEWAQGVERVRRDHAAIRGMASDLLGPDGDPTPDDARTLGEMLNDHVRFEERQLFPLLEDRLPAQELEALGRSVERAERG